MWIIPVKSVHDVRIILDDKLFSIKTESWQMVYLDPVLEP